MSTISKSLPGLPFSCPISGKKVGIFQNMLSIALNQLLPKSVWHRNTDIVPIQPTLNTSDMQSRALHLR